MGCLAMIQPRELGQLTLLERVEMFLEKHSLSPTNFGLIAAKTPSLVFRMRSGKRLHQATIARVEALLDERAHWSKSHRIILPSQMKAARYARVVSETAAAERKERERRLTDPGERAATFLRSRGWRVYRASVHHADAEGWCVGTGKLSDEGLLERATRSGWRG